MRNPIIVALDLRSAEEALALVDRLTGKVGAFKVGSELFTAAGPEVVRHIRARGSGVFLDLKFHDIPNTVSGAVEAAVRLDVQMLTVHTSAGREILTAAEQAAQSAARALNQTPPLVLGVTVLTSIDSNELVEIGCEGNVAHQVERLATLGVQCGLRGLVCSPLEIAGLRTFLPAGVQLVTPGIRHERKSGDDQKRTLTAAEAMKAGADWLVIGRPIYAAPDPVRAAEDILASLGG
jgi:orotidine-5'-phosphate decarboxylase